MYKYNQAHKCPKCGGVAHTKYDEMTGTIARVCDRCGYRWHEDPLDSREPAVNKPNT